MSTPNIEKLPKWAQDEIRGLRVRLAYLQDQYDSMFQAEPSNVQLWDLEENKNLPPNSGIIFHLDENERIDCRIENGRLYVSSYFDKLSVRPWAANAIKLEVIP